MLAIQIILVVFLLFALSRVILRFRGKQIKSGEFGFWTIIFLAAILVIAFPAETTRLANALGVGRGVDLIVYASIALLFYLVFRIYVLLENLRHEITEVVRKIALRRIRQAHRGESIEPQAQGKPSLK